MDADNVFSGARLIFGENERSALVALVELWRDGLGDPIELEAIAARVGADPFSVNARLNVCVRLRLAVAFHFGTVTQGWVPRVTLEQIPAAEPYPEAKIGGTSKRMAEKRRRESR